MGTSTRRPFFCGNWKLHGTITESVALATEVRNGVATLREADVVVAPSFAAIHAVARRLEDGPVAVSGQNCFWEDKGAFTGEISPTMLAGLVDYVILGHSERRELFSETDAALQRKVPAALAASLLPMLCVGETEQERDAGETERKLRHQIQSNLADVDDGRLERVTIAYEPIWAIGTGNTATPEQAQEAIAFVRALIGDRSPAAADGVRILYGGSVNAGNAADLLGQPDIDGALVGGASLDPAEFAAIIAAAPR
jgi:triosephosphate isomerase